MSIHHDSADSQSIPEANRRSFLSWSLAATAAAVPAIGLARSAQAQDFVVSSRKHRVNLGKKLPELYRGWNSRNFHEIRNDEDTHVATIVKLLGAMARPKPTFQNLEASTYHDFAMKSQAFENTGVGAYLGALPYIHSQDLVKAAGSIALIEGYHSGYLNTLLNSSIAPNNENFAQPLTIADVLGAAGGFITSLNGGPPLTFTTTPSDENDIAIVNFALALEFLEKEFYDINVPKFFG